MNLIKLLAQSIIWRGFYFFSVLLVNVFLSRYLQAAASGNLYFITIIFSFMQAVLSLGFESAITYYASGKLITRNNLIHFTAVWSFCAGLLMIGFVYAYFVVDASMPAALLRPYCIYGFFYICGQTFMNFVTALYYSKENFFLPNFLLGLVNIVFVFFIPSKDAPVTQQTASTITIWYFATFFISGVLLYFSFLWSNRKEGRFGFMPSGYRKKFVYYAFTALSANVIFFLVYRIDYLFVHASKFASDADLGNYIQVSKLGQMMLILPQIMASVVFPKTAGGMEHKQMSNAIMVMARLFSQLFLFVFIVVLLFGKTFFILIFGETFNSMQWPMLLLIPGIFSLSVLALLSAYFSGKGNVKVNVRGAALALIVMVIGDYFFVLPYGIIAAAAISTISYFVNTGYSLYIFYKDHSINLVEFFRWRKSDYDFLSGAIARIKK